MRNFLFSKKICMKNSTYLWQYPPIEKEIPSSTIFDISKWVIWSKVYNLLYKTTRDLKNRADIENDRYLLNEYIQLSLRRKERNEAIIWPLPPNRNARKKLQIFDDYWNKIESFLDVYWNMYQKTRKEEIKIREEEKVWKSRRENLQQ